MDKTVLTTPEGDGVWTYLIEADGTTSGWYATYGLADGTTLVIANRREPVDPTRLYKGAETVVASAVYADGVDAGRDLAAGTTPTVRRWTADDAGAGREAAALAAELADDYGVPRPTESRLTRRALAAIADYAARD